MRIASLVPSATEALFELGLGDRVVAVTHECDWPASVRSLPRLTKSALPDELPPAQIDRAVRERTARGESLYELDRDLLAGLAVDLIVTQAVCPVCAVSYEEVCELADALPGEARVLSLDPATLDGVLDDLPVLAAACGSEGRGTRLRAELAERIERVRRATTGAERPRVVALEWLDPPFLGGHWVPEMIAAAGGRDELTAPGSRSRETTWEELRAHGPEVVVVMPCGLYAEEAAQQAALHSRELEALGASRVVAVDAASSFSRPGPRLADGVELLGHLLHPGRVPATQALRYVEIGGTPAPRAWL